MTIDVYIIGMSNTDAIRAALADYKGPVTFHIDRLNPRLENGGFFQKQFDPDFFRERLTQASLVVLSLWGNWYNTLALVEHAEPFDFVYPSFDERVDETRRIIPFMQISRSFRNGIREQLRMLNILRPMTREKMILLEPPPPIESEDHIRKYPGPFVEALSAGITPANIRLKLWKLQSSMYVESCAEHGIDFIPFPPEATSDKGFLAPDYCFPDPGHANARYGNIMLDELAEILRGLK
ncbi:hypothetical protein [Neorhizobium alkalisoli]|uniref:SGNH/GDSL hydrolase family protein n=1 Tax=Neorhizobium alkalisoli TaxID=528178 RepID=A0A561QGZ1_9HYPH|nr:hypothetical protein [Neorhizobium alkalisoli]TWF49644.1 hypothetical protein FHW37_10710 [Neorhizobium alkalisoli]